MRQIDSLYSVLEENLELYENFTKLEYDKYMAVVKDDIKKLDEIISKEQVYYLKAKGLEQKREKLTDSMNMKNKTLKEIIETSDDENSYRLKLLYDKLFKSLDDFKKINSECKTIIEIKLHGIEVLLCKLGERDNNYFIGENQKNNLKNHIVSKKI